MRPMALLVAVAVLAGACGDDSPAAPTPTTAPTAVTTTAPPTTAPTTAPTSIAPTTTAPGPVWPAARGWVVGSSAGLVALDERGERTTLVTGPVATVAVAPDGTVFFQRASLLFGRTETTTATDTRVLAVDRATGAARDLLVPVAGADAEAGALHLDGVAIVDGRVQLLLRRAHYDPSRNVEEQRWQEAFRRDLLSGAETPGRRVGVWELQATHISYGGGVLVHTNRSEDQRRGVVVDLAGEVVNRFAALVPEGWCGDASPGCPDALTISPSGARLAWIESPDPFGSPERRWNVVVADTVTGRRVASVVLPAGNAETVLTFAGDERLAVSRFPWPDAASTAPTAGVVEVGAGTYAPLPVGGYAVPDVAR